MGVRDESLKKQQQHMHGILVVLNYSLITLSNKDALDSHLNLEYFFVEMGNKPLLFCVPEI